MKTLPADVVEYQRTEVYSEQTVPASFLTQPHSTKPGVWCRVVVREGALLYRVLSPEVEAHVLVAGRPGIVEPEVRHAFELRGAVRFHIEFLS